MAPLRGASCFFHFPSESGASDGASLLRGANMTEHIAKSDFFQEMMEEIIDEHKEEFGWIHDRGVAICAMESDRKKKKGGCLAVLGECIKVKALYAEFCPYDFIIVIYSPNVRGKTEDQLRILMYHELLHAGMREVKGEPVYFIRPHDEEEFRTVIDRYGLDWC